MTLAVRASELETAIFDCDGVLLDSNHIKSEGFRKLARELEAEVADEFVAYHQRHGGVSRYVKIRHLMEEMIDSNFTEEEIAGRVRRYGEIVTEDLLEADTIQGVRSTLEALGDAGLSLYVVSGGKEEELHHVLGARGLGRFFDEIRGSPTPKSDIVSELVEAGRVVPERSIYFGDSRLDYRIAVERDIPFVMVTAVTEWDGWEDERSHMQGVIRTFDELTVV